MDLSRLVHGVDPEVLAFLKTAGVYIVVTGALLALRSVLFRQLHRWAQRTSTVLDDLILHALRTPSAFWAVAGGLDITLRFTAVAPEVRAVASRALLVLVILSATLVGANIAGGAVTHALRRQGPEAGVPGLAQVVVRTVVVLLGGMVGLNALGVEIAPLLTALGVGGLAVALALQETLSNFFAGLHILMERPFHIGHFIRIEDGRGGHVLDIGWRTTRIRTLDDDVIVVPNAKIAGSTIVNCHMPIPRSRVKLRIGAGYGPDPHRVARVLLEELEAARAETRHILAEPAPRALLLALAESAQEFELRFFVDDVAAEDVVCDILNRRIYLRFGKEGIEIPFPSRTVYLRRTDA